MNARNRLAAERPTPIPPDKLEFPFELKFTCFRAVVGRQPMLASQRRAAPSQMRSVNQRFHLMTSERRVAGPMRCKQEKQRRSQQNKVLKKNLGDAEIAGNPPAV